jgi:hypothetical protein
MPDHGRSGKSRPQVAAALVALWAALSVSGCKRLTRGARERFGTQFSCPEDRVEVRARDDLDPGMVVYPAETPPEEIKDDPGRLAKWKKDLEAHRDRWRDADDKAEVFDVSGCGHAARYVCYHPRSMSANAGSIDESSVECLASHP